MEDTSLPLSTFDKDRSCHNRLSVSDPNVFEGISPANGLFENPSEIDFLAGANYQDSVEYYNRYATYHILKRNLPVAKAALMRAAVLDSTIAYSFYNLGIVESMDHEYESALLATELAESMCPNDFSTIANKGYILLALDRYVESVAYCTRAFNLDSLNRRNVGNLIHSHYRSNNKAMGDYYLQYMKENLILTEADQVSFEKFREENNYR